MKSFDPHQLGLKVGLEVHQQLATRSKLFCSCRPVDEPEFQYEFLRRLRPTQSELGQVDPAALFEFKKGKMIKYEAGRESACLVEADEEPPHDLNQEALEAAMLIALALDAKPVDEIHVMRKIVIDGSNTTGFQRTAVIALGGTLEVDGDFVDVQTVCLEEDAARMLGEEGNVRCYGLDRLCVPLVEVALKPVTATPEKVEEIALSLGRLMRSTGRVARGLGTIRQDVNISLLGQGVIEVKGVQKLNLLSKVIDFEVKRQLGLLQVARELQNRRIKPEDVSGGPKDVTDVFQSSPNRILRRTVERGGKVFALKLKGFKGLLGFEPYPDVRLGKEMAELVRFYGLGGIFHSDELPGYEIDESTIKSLRDALFLDENDGFVILAGSKDDVYEASYALIERVKEAIKGVPAETRAATEDGKTRFSRPRPGAARMYPETDIPPIVVSSEMLEGLRKLVPRPWQEEVREYMIRYGLSEKLALQIYDSGYTELFKRLASMTKVAPSFIAATLTETFVSLSRMGLDPYSLPEPMVEELFVKIDQGGVSKEAVPQILEELIKGGARNVEEAVEKLGLKGLSNSELYEVIRKVVSENLDQVKTKGERSFGLLMGKVMSVVRGRADGQKVSNILKEEIKKIIIETSK